METKLKYSTQIQEYRIQNGHLVIVSSKMQIFVMEIYFCFIDIKAIREESEGIIFKQTY